MRLIRIHLTLPEDLENQQEREDDKLPQW